MEDPKNDEMFTQSQLSPEQREQLQALNRAYIEYAERIDRWVKANGNTPPPFRWDRDREEFVWANRAQRRGIKK